MLLDCSQVTYIADFFELRVAIWITTHSILGLPGAGSQLKRQQKSVIIHTALGLLAHTPQRFLRRRIQ
jgi:hypothetical protein